MMKEHPILFKGEMVRAILDGRKTQTRRILKKRHWPTPGDAARGLTLDQAVPEVRGKYPFLRLADGGEFGGPIRCPFGVPGDRLWVREAFVMESDYEYAEIGSVPTDRPVMTITDPVDGDYHLIPHYRATEPDASILPGVKTKDGEFERTAWKPSIHMPRWASRIDLEVLAVRVERVKEVSGADALAEGITIHPDCASDEVLARCDFCGLWESINGKRGFGWDVNPWVWVVEFRLMPKAVKPVPVKGALKIYRRDIDLEFESSAAGGAS